jgi:hypothetical protein
MGKRLWAKAPTTASGEDRRPPPEGLDVKKRQVFGWTLVAMDIAVANFSRSSCGLEAHKVIRKWDRSTAIRR